MIAACSAQAMPTCSFADTTANRKIARLFLRASKT
jgi:hypothetical protein